MLDIYAFVPPLQEDSKNPGVEGRLVEGVGIDVSKPKNQERFQILRSNIGGMTTAEDITAEQMHELLTRCLQNGVVRPRHINILQTGSNSPPLLRQLSIR